MSKNLEAVRESTQQHIQFFMSRKDTMDVRTADFIGHLDPDLSITTKVVNEFLADPNYLIRTDLLHQYFGIGQTLMIRGMREAHEKPVTKKETNQHLEALGNISQVIKKLPESDQKSSKDSLLTLFSFAAARRPDLVEQQNFPWEEAIDAAQETPMQFMTPYFPFRFAILKHAPKDILKKKVLSYTQRHDHSVLDILDAEFPMIGQEDYWLDQDLYDLIASMPRGNKAIARSTLFWAVKATANAFWRQKETTTNERNIPVAYLNRLWESAEQQWQGLPAEDQGQLLRFGLLSYINGLFNEGNNIALKDSGLSISFSRFSNLVNEIASNVSEEGKKFIIQEYTNAFKVYPKLNVPAVVEGWFPDVAKAIEANRPKTIFQKIFPRNS